MPKPLTPAAIEKIRKPEKGSRDVSDGACRGLKLRITDKGSMTWRFESWRGNKRQLATFGPYPAISLKKAREMAEEARTAVVAGKAPSAPEDARKAVLADQKAKTFEAAARLFIGRHALQEGVKNGKPLRSAHQMKQRLENFVFPELGQKPIREITRVDIKAFYDKIATTRGPVLAARLLGLIRTIYNWCSNQTEWMTPELPNPVRRGLITYKERSRDRALDENEMRKLWLAAGTIGEPWGIWIRMLVLTAQRRSTVASMRWDDLNLEDKIWIIPGTSMKNGKEHFVPLSEPAVELLNQVKRGNGPYVFSTTLGSRPISGISKPLGKLRKETGVPHFTIHDLRRSSATLMQDLGFNRDIIGAVLAHTNRDVTSIYTRSQLLALKRAALDAVAKHLLEEQKASNVVQLTRTA